MTAQIWRFGSHELDGSRGELRKNGRRVHLKPQPFAVLTALVEKRGGIVTRQELKEWLWHDEPAYQTDENLNHAVKRLREALGDSADNPRFVATVRQHGYRFLADISTENVGAERSGRALDARGTRFLAAAGGAAATLGVLLVATTRKPSTAPPPPIVRATVPLQGALTFGPLTAVAISPDGQTIAYTAGEPSQPAHLYVHDLASGESRVVPRTEHARSPVFSPDGKRIAFYALRQRTLMQVATDGGTPTPIARIQTANHGIAWTESGDIVFTSSTYGGLSRLSPNGRPETLTSPDLARREKNHRLPDPLPGGRALLMTVGTVDITSFDDASIALVGR